MTQLATDGSPRITLITPARNRCADEPDAIEVTAMGASCPLYRRSSSMSELARVFCINISKYVTSVVLAWGFTSLGFPAQVVAAVHAAFELSTPASGPFPSDWFTIPDASHNTRRRVNLPLPECALRPSDCEDLNVINTLDGFSADPRVSIPFDGPIDVTTVTSETVFLVRLGSLFCEYDDACDDDGDDGHVTGINQMVWDPVTNTLHVKSNEFLDQHTRYGLIATNRLRDAQGRPVEASQTFRRFRQTVRGEYKQALLEAIHAARRIGVCENEIVAASVAELPRAEVR